MVPLFGAAAYLLAKPLRKKVLVRLALDQMATVLPFRAYDRFHLQRWLAPAAGHSQPETDGPVYAQD